MTKKAAPRILQLRAERVLRKPTRGVYRVDGFPNVVEVHLNNGDTVYVDLRTKNVVDQPAAAETKQRQPRGFISRGDALPSEVAPAKTEKPKRASKTSKTTVTKQKPTRKTKSSK